MKKIISIILFTGFIGSINAQISMNSTGRVTFSKGINFGNGTCYANYDFKIHPSGLAYPSIYIYKSTGNVGIKKGPNTASYALDVGSTMRVVSTLYTSDKKLKKNIKDIKKDKIEKIHTLKAKEYDLDNTNSFFDPTDDALTRKHYGLIAQEVKKIYPELVSEDSAGILSINYIEMIPLLIEALKEQQYLINRLDQKIEGSDVKATYSPVEEFQRNSFLKQNQPNPFNESSTIEYYLGDNTNEATFYIYNLNGMQLKSIPLHHKGYNSITINGGEFKAGMYIYSLITDGILIDTKQMILTD